MCEHERFEANVDVARVTDGEDGPVIRYHADISVRCAGCLEPFVFVGLPEGFDFNAPTMSPFGLEARLPLKPQKETMPSLEGKVRGFRISRLSRPGLT